jgi:hypothetical protein
MFSRRSWRWFAMLAVLALPACTSVQESDTVAEEPVATEGMTTYALCAPIPADQVDAWKAMIEEMDTNRDAHVAANASVGVDREHVWLQETPDGATAVVVFQGTDLGGLMARRAAAEDEHSQWFVKQITSIHGLPEDLGSMPANEMVFQGDVDGIEGETQPYALAAPLLPGKVEAHAAMLAEFEGPRREAWLESRRARGIAKEYVWNQTAPDGSIFTVVYFEITDPANLSSPSQSEFETWFRDQIMGIHGIPADAPFPANVLAGSY